MPLFLTSSAVTFIAKDWLRNVRSINKRDAGGWLGVKGRYRIVLCCFRWAERNRDSSATGVGPVPDVSLGNSTTGERLRKKNNLKVLDFVFLLTKLVVYHVYYLMLTNCLID